MPSVEIKTPGVRGTHPGKCGDKGKGTKAKAKGVRCHKRPPRKAGARGKGKGSAVECWWGSAQEAHLVEIYEFPVCPASVLYPKTIVIGTSK